MLSFGFEVWDVSHTLEAKGSDRLLEGYRPGCCELGHILRQNICDLEKKNISLAKAIEVRDMHKGSPRTFDECDSMTIFHGFLWIKLPRAHGPGSASLMPGLKVMTLCLGRTAATCLNGWLQHHSAEPLGFAQDMAFLDDDLLNATVAANSCQNEVMVAVAHHGKLHGCILMQQSIMLHLKIASNERGQTASRSTRILALSHWTSHRLRSFESSQV